MTEEAGGGIAAWWRQRRGDAVWWTEVVQVVKTGIAAVAAWLLARDVLGLSQSFLAPWAALLVVHATVYRTFSRGVRQVGGAVVGVLLAWSLDAVLGVGPVSVGLLIVVGLGIGALPWFAEETTVAAATGLVVLTTGGASQGVLLVDRLVDTAVGVAVGLVVNLLVWPPLRRRTAIAAVDAIDDELGAMLHDLAEELDGGLGDGPDQRLDLDRLEGWIDRTRDLDGDIARAWSLARQARESARLNPRRSARQLRRSEPWSELLRRLEQGVAETRSLLRTVQLSYERDDTAVWHPAFAEPWVDALRRTGRAILDADADAVRAVDRSLVDIAAAGGSGDAEAWPVQGGLLINLRNLVEAFAVVAEANPLPQPPLPTQNLRLPRRTATGS